MGWQDDARRLVIGPETELKSFPGYHIKPKKYSVSANDEIQALVREVQRGIDKKALVEMMSKVKDYEGDITKEELIKRMDPTELGALLDINSVPTARLAEVRLRNGIAEHNFEGVTVAELAKYVTGDNDFPKEIVSEMLSIVENFNRPLAPKTSKTSGTSPSGSTMEQSSSGEMSFQTDGTQQD